jgi:hypothetical protein
VQAAILLIIDVLFPLVITIIELIRSRCRKGEDINELDKLLNDKDDFVFFEEFCKVEYSIENLACWVDIQEYKKTRNDPMGLYMKYCNGTDSPMEVNCERKTCLVALEKIKSGSVENDLFSDVELEVMINMRETFSRFPRWAKYIAHVANKKKQLELIEGKK